MTSARSTSTLLALIRDHDHAVLPASVGASANSPSSAVGDG